MTILERIAGLWFAVLDASALAAAALASRVSTRQRIVAQDGGNGELVLYREGQTGGPVLTRLVPAAPDAPASRLLRRSHVTIELDPSRFIFRVIALPGRATEFIDAIVQTQIDRLTPWRPDQVVFGWSEPVSHAADGTISLTVAAAGKETVAPLLQRFQDLGAASVIARVALPADMAASPAESVVVARSAAAAFAVTFWRRWFGIATAIVVVLVILSSLAGQGATMYFGSIAEDLDRLRAEKRALIAQAISDRDPLSRSRQLVKQHRSDEPYATLVLEAASRLLPDDTFVTSFELAGTRLRLVGFTADAPALIRLIETSDAFVGATFFAPTTRLVDDPGDRFSIEATVRPDAFTR